MMGLWLVIDGKQEGGGGEEVEGESRLALEILGWLKCYF